MVSDIFDAMRQMQREMDNVFSRFYTDTDTPLLTQGTSTTPARHHSPLTDVVEHDDEIVATLDMPGLSKEDIDIQVDDRGLTVRAQREAKNETKDENVYRLERRYTGFQRRIPLPENVDADSADATYENGVLTVTLPKLSFEGDAGRRIDIN